MTIRKSLTTLPFAVTRANFRAISIYLAYNQLTNFSFLPVSFGACCRGVSVLHKQLPSRFRAEQALHLRLINTVRLPPLWQICWVAY